ncbi:MAG: hypothetical protein AB7I52_06530, partial [Rhizobiaceae bacterium]
MRVTGGGAGSSPSYPTGSVVNVVPTQRHKNSTTFSGKYLILGQQHAESARNFEIAHRATPHCQINIGMHKIDHKRIDLIETQSPDLFWRQCLNYKLKS